VISVTSTRGYGGTLLAHLAGPDDFWKLLGPSSGGGGIKGNQYSIAEHRVPELIPVLDSQPAGGVSHKPGCRPPLLSARPAVKLATLKRAATSFGAW